MTDVTTTDLADFGARERCLLIEILKAWEANGLPDDFYHEEVRPMLNKNSGYVFLTNAEFQTAFINGDKLETWYNCSRCGHEGFAEDCRLTDEGCNECHKEEAQ